MQTNAMLKEEFRMHSETNPVDVHRISFYFSSRISPDRNRQTEVF